MSDAADRGLLLNEVCDLLYREAACLDEQRYDDWLDLFTQDCEYWLPAWKGDHQPTEDPKRELSLIYYNARSGLEDRVWRVQSGQSVASQPVPRTGHFVANVEIEKMTEGVIPVSASWQTHSYMHKNKSTVTFFGRYHYGLVRAGEALRIKRKKIVLMNDYIPTMLDFYNI